MILFNRPYLCGREIDYLEEAMSGYHLSGDGPFTQRCHAWLEQETRAAHALLTHSCTAALEMAAMLLDIEPGDEVIMPSYTFVSTANAFVLRGARPVFVDVRADTFNLDENLIEAAITERTRAIVVVHYAGVSCDMAPIMALAELHGLPVVEDAAQGIRASYDGIALGSIGHIGTLSFHESKNVIAGEGGALLLRDDTYALRAEIMREKGTNRSQFFRGMIDKYTWIDAGSSYLPSELTAAFLYAQFEEVSQFNGRRLRLWDTYHEAFATLEQAGVLRRPSVPVNCVHNAHMYYLLLDSFDQRSRFIEFMLECGVATTFHYVPLHDSPMGQRCGIVPAPLPVTEIAGERLVRLPLYAGLTAAEQAQVIESALAYFSSI